MESSTLKRLPSIAPAERPAIADQLRRMADWFMDHPDAQSDVMSASAQKNQRLPRVAFYHVATLAAAFPGQAALKRRFQDSFVYTICRDGIDFEAWEKPDHPHGEEREVLL